MAETWLVVGLGNPGPRYETTRHNVGQLVVDELAARRGEGFKAHKANARVAETWLRPGGAKIVLAKPNSFMNVSGGPVAGLVRFYGIEPERVVVVHDELDIPFDTIRLKVGGGRAATTACAMSRRRSALRNSPACASASAGRSGRQDPADYVLDPFAAAERRRCRSWWATRRTPSSSSSTSGCSTRSSASTHLAPDAYRAVSMRDGAERHPRGVGDLHREEGQRCEGHGGDAPRPPAAPDDRDDALHHGPEDEDPPDGEAGDALDHRASAIALAGPEGLRIDVGAGAAELQQVDYSAIAPSERPARKSAMPPTIRAATAARRATTPSRRGRRGSASSDGTRALESATDGRARREAHHERDPRDEGEDRRRHDGDDDGRDPRPRPCA